MLCCLIVEGELGAELDDLLLNFSVIAFDVGKNGVDQLSGLDHFSFLEASGRHCSSSDTDTGGNEGRLSLIWYGVLVDSDTHFVQPVFSQLAGDALVCKVHQHEVVVRSTGDQLVAMIHEFFSQRCGILDDLSYVSLEFRLHGFMETDSLSGYDMLQGSALHAWEYCLI